ncbi:hypothetical protein H4R20_006335 [Coemansia guatemalensis]|uniref:Uncharacterized protein n=1 Tax=Coemansia guatemalensis TaxID=2761395 RepID=A0A9W8HN07_9FUNG|nr:hypothetical protein H4R20_006335 [Coemansia guatemalensis]
MVESHAQKEWVIDLEEHKRKQKKARRVGGQEIGIKHLLQKPRAPSMLACALALKSVLVPALVVALVSMSAMVSALEPVFAMAVLRPRAEKYVCHQQMEQVDGKEPCKLWRGGAR